MTAHTHIEVGVGDEWGSGTVSQVASGHITVQFNNGPRCTDFDRELRPALCSTCVLGVAMAHAARNGGQFGVCPYSPLPIEQQLDIYPGWLLKPWEAIHTRISTTTNTKLRAQYRWLLHRFLSGIARTHASSLGNGPTLRAKLDDMKSQAKARTAH